MHSTDIIAYHYDGAVYCPDCIDTDSRMDDESWPVFAEQEEQKIGATCGACGACYGPDGWEEEQQIGDEGYFLVALLWRWSRCHSCGDQRPWRGTKYTPYQSEDVDARCAALRGELHCRNCLKPSVHF